MYSEKILESVAEGKSVRQVIDEMSNCFEKWTIDYLSGRDYIQVIPADLRNRLEKALKDADCKDIDKVMNGTLDDIIDSVPEVDWREVLKDEPELESASDDDYLSPDDDTVIEKEINDLRRKYSKALAELLKLNDLKSMITIGSYSGDLEVKDPKLVKAGKEDGNQVYCFTAYDPELDALYEDLTMLLKQTNYSAEHDWKPKQYELNLYVYVPEDYDIKSIQDLIDAYEKSGKPVKELINELIKQDDIVDVLYACDTV